MECVELAPAVGCVARFESGSKLHALHTPRAVWFRLCRPGDRRALPPRQWEAVKKLKTPEIRARKCLITKKYFLRFGDYSNFFTASDRLRLQECALLQF